MRIHQLKVRPKKSLLSAPCSAELAALLACWASTDSVMGAPVLGVGSVPKVGGAVPSGAGGAAAGAGLGTHGACANAMRGLEECMRRAVSRLYFLLSRAPVVLCIVLTDKSFPPLVFFLVALQATAPRAKARPAINYHLAKWGKQL